jgi:peptidoglycan/LPS O-acetylase OafA/YrhL
MKRIQVLDSMRGLAALAVVAGHCISAFHASHTVWDLTPLYFFWAGNEAVVFFFVLSGLVLSIPFATGKSDFSYVPFAIRRVCRIYIPYAAAMVLVLIACSLIANDAARPIVSWLRDQWLLPVPPSAVVDHALLVGHFNTNAYNPVIWSLVHEMRLSLVFPVVLYLGLRLSWPMLLVLACTTAAILGISNLFGLQPSMGFHNSYVWTLHYATLFVAGVMIARDADKLIALWQSLSQRVRYGMLGAALLAYTYGRMLYLVPQKLGLKPVAVLLEPFSVILVAAAAVVAVIAALASRGQGGFLERPLPLYFGKLSYSLYLLHLPVMLAVLSVLYWAPWWVFLAVSLPASLAVSALFYRFVEQPAAQLGRWIVAAGSVLGARPRRAG